MVCRDGSTESEHGNSSGRGENSRSDDGNGGGESDLLRYVTYVTSTRYHPDPVLVHTTYVLYISHIMSCRIRCSETRNEKQEREEEEQQRR